MTTAIDLEAAAREIIRREAPLSEAAGSLTPALLELAHREGWFRLLVPAKYGGEELPLPELLQLEEQLAAADGGLAWAVTLCAGAGWFGGFLEGELAAQVFAHPQLCIGGSGAATGTAEKTRNGYLLNGSWAHASGASYASHFTANCIVSEGGKPLLEHGQAVVRAFIVPAAAVEVSPTWKATGLRSSASHRFSITAQEVPASHCFGLSPGDAKMDATLYRYPFLPLAEATLAVNVFGMARHFYDCAPPLLERRDRQGRIIAGLAEVRGLQKAFLQEVAGTRKRLQDIVAQSWTQCEKTGQVAEALQAAIGDAARLLCRQSRAAVNALFPYCGLAAADTSTEINRVWRDLHTGAQHSLLL